jgi:hypothetical protein
MSKKVRLVGGPKHGQVITVDNHSRFIEFKHKLDRDDSVLPSQIRGDWLTYYYELRACGTYPEEVEWYYVLAGVDGNDANSWVADNPLPKED